VLCSRIRPAEPRLDAVFKEPALVAGLDDVAVVGEPVEQRGGHLGVAREPLRPVEQAD
jgi:hypothetical protein